MTEYKTCDICLGKGKIRNYNGDENTYIKCPVCKGTGIIIINTNLMNEKQFKEIKVNNVPS